MLVGMQWTAPEADFSQSTFFPLFKIRSKKYEQLPVIFT
ncbi:hypothetical protein B4064_1546 [Caldibacillus thermoamylovorans]|nr:hypothetical protein B4064_1546 [Caldibacillus thermoamylovorans]